MKRKKGSFYIETIIALGILGTITTSLLPLYPRLLQATKKTEERADLITITEYAGEYLFRWTNFSPNNKHQQISAFSDGDELELSSELRLNQLPWADPLINQFPDITDHYKASMTFWETTSRNNSAVINVLVWYDKNLDNVCTPTENSFTFSTIITEKQD